MKKHSSSLNCCICCFKLRMWCRISSFSWDKGESLYMIPLYFFFCTCWWYLHCKTSTLTQTFLLNIYTVRSIWCFTTWNVSNITKKRLGFTWGIHALYLLLAARTLTKSRFGYIYTNNDLNYLVFFKLKIFLILKKREHRSISSELPFFSCIKAINQN